MTEIALSLLILILVGIALGVVYVGVILMVKKFL